jgi:hypothetical protein
MKRNADGLIFISFPYFFFFFREFCFRVSLSTRPRTGQYKHGCCVRERVQPAIPRARFYYYCYYFSSRFFMAVVLSTDLNQKKKNLCQPSILFFYFFLRRRIYENDFSRREKERKKVEPPIFD